MKRGISNKLTKKQKNRIRNTRKKIKGGMPDDYIIKNAKTNDPIKYIYKMKALMISNENDDVKTRIIQKLFSKILRILKLKDFSGRLSDIKYIIARKQKHRECKEKSSNACKNAIDNVENIKKANKNLTTYKRFTLRHKTISGLSMKVLNRILTSSIDYYQIASDETKPMIKDALQLYFTSQKIDLKKYIFDRDGDDLGDDLTDDEINILNTYADNKPTPEELKNAEQKMFDPSESESGEEVNVSLSQEVNVSLSPEYNYKIFKEIIGEGIDTINEDEFKAIIQIDNSGGKIMGGAPFGYVLGFIGIILLVVFLFGCGMATAGGCLAALILCLIFMSVGSFIAKL